MNSPVQIGKVPTGKSPVQKVKVPTHLNSQVQIEKVPTGKSPVQIEKVPTHIESVIQIGKVPTQVESPIQIGKVPTHVESVIQIGKVPTQVESPIQIGKVPVKKVPTKTRASKHVGIIETETEFVSGMPHPDNGVYTPNTISRVGDNSLLVGSAQCRLPKTNTSTRRSSLYPGRVSEAEHSIYSRSEVVNLGLDFVTDQSNLVTEIERMSRVANQGVSNTECAFPARKRAIETPNYTGDLDWSKWFAIFTQDCTANGWTEEENYAALRVRIRQGPGSVCLREFDRGGGGTYMSLVTAMTVACGATDPDLRWRIALGLRQAKGETSRNYGLRVMDVVREASMGSGLPESYVMRKCCEIYINGLRDLGLRERLNVDYDHRFDSMRIFSIEESNIFKESTVWPLVRLRLQKIVMLLLWHGITLKRWTLMVCAQR